MTAFVLIAILTAAALASPQPCPQPFQSYDLIDKHHFHAFSNPKEKHPRNAQQGVVFVSPDSLVVFQVEKPDQVAPLASRDISGGAGSFVLHIILLDTRQKFPPQSLDLTTTGSDVSRVYPTREGKFIVRTGDVIRLYSAALAEIASRALPRRNKALNEFWNVAVDNRGAQIYLEHYEYFGPKMPAQTERFLVDADTLQTLAVLDSSSTSLLKQQFYHHWDRDFPKASLTTKEEHVPSVVGNDLLLAAEITRWRRDPLDFGIPPVPLRIVVYDLATKTERCFISTDSPVSDGSDEGARLYAISSTGTIAVIQRGILSLYQP